MGIVTTRAGESLQVSDKMMYLKSFDSLYFNTRNRLLVLVTKKSETEVFIRSVNGELKAQTSASSLTRTGLAAKIAKGDYVLIEGGSETYPLRLSSCIEDFRRQSIGEDDGTK